MGSTPVASGHKAGITGLALDGTTSETWQLGSASAERWRLSGGTGTSGVFALQNRRGGLWADVWQSVDYGSGLITNAINGLTSLALNYDAVDAPQNVLTLTANKLTAPIGAGYGVSFTMQAEDSTTEYVGLGGAAWSWTNPVHVSRSSKAVLSVIENAVSVDALTITGTGISTPALTLTGSQTANYVFAAPNGSAGAPSFRALVATDIPTLTLSKISDAGTIASQAANSVAITGGMIDNTTLGATTPTTGAFTTLSASTSLSVTAGTAATVPVTVKGAASQSGNLAEFKTSADVLKASISALGGIEARMAAGENGSSGSGFRLYKNNTWIFGIATDAPNNAPTLTSYSQKLSINAGSSGDQILSLNASGVWIYTIGVASSVQNELNLHTNMSGTPVSGFGTALTFNLKTSTTSDVRSGRIASLWNVATHVSREGDLVLYASDANGEREGLRVRANGSAGAIGFLGATPAIQQTGGAQTATGTWTATEQDMLQKAYDALRTFGLLT